MGIQIGEMRKISGGMRVKAKHRANRVVQERLII